MDEHIKKQPSSDGCFLRQDSNSNDLYRQLVDSAISARRHAYTPYSGFAVGAALLCADGHVVTGCNVENAAYGLTNCAERTAVFKAVSEGYRRFSAIAVVTDTDGPCAPCGACRQVIGEFSIPLIIMANLRGDMRVVTIEELLPFAFTDRDL